MVGSYIEVYRENEKWGKTAKRNVAMLDFLSLSEQPYGALNTSIHHGSGKQLGRARGVDENISIWNSAILQKNLCSDDLSEWQKWTFVRVFLFHSYYTSYLHLYYSIQSSSSSFSLSAVGTPSGKCLFRNSDGILIISRWRPCPRNQMTDDTWAHGLTDLAPWRHWQ